VPAVMISTVVVMGAAGLLFACGAAMMSIGPIAAAVVLPFTPFPALQALVDSPGTFDPAGTAGATLLESVRITVLFFSLISASAYLAITYSIYRSMVQGFDMTVRRQSA